MSKLFDDASLAMIPSAYKDGKLYSIRPTDGSGDFTFSRGSNLAATRVDVNGLIEKGRENLLLQSNQFDTTWTNYLSNETSGQAGYDGSNDAWLLAKTGASGHMAQAVSPSGVNTFSVYVKAGTLNWVLLIEVGGGNRERYFDLQNGVLGGSSYTNEIDSKIEPIGNGWYRCSITTNISFTQVRIYPANADGDTSGTSGSIYIQDAQLEAGLVATDYIETGASTAQAGILEDMPRLDYSGGASCPALLLEPQRTNGVTQSEYFEGWTNKPDVALDFGYLAPDGTNSAYKVTKTGVQAHIADSFGGIIVSGVHKSIWAKTTSGTGNVYLINQTGQNLVTLTNEWQRFDVTHNGANFFYAVDFRGGAVTLTEVLLWGAQAETGSYPTSYIPTYGSSVTRLYDDCDILNLVSKGIITDATEWTIMFEVDGFSTEYNSGDGQWFAGQDSTLDVYMRPNATTDAYAKFYWRKDGKYIGGILGKKIIARLSNGIGTDFVDGVKIASGSITGDYSNIGFNKSSNPSAAGYVKQILVFPTALTDSECIALTTL